MMSLCDWETVAKRSSLNPIHVYKARGRPDMHSLQRQEKRMIQKITLA